MQPESMQEKIYNSLHIIRLNAGENAAVSFSGGNDSLVALDLAIRCGIKKAVFCDTTVEFPETIEYVKKIAYFYNIDLDITTPPESFFGLLENGMLPPSRMLRWCCKPLKVAPLGRYALINGLSSYITGLRDSEGRNRRKYKAVDYNPLIQAKRINPIINWSREDVNQYIEEYSLPINPLYEKGYRRVGCWCCPHSSTKDYWNKLKDTHNNLYTFLLDEIKSLFDNIGATYDTVLGFWEWGMHFTNSLIVGTYSVKSNNESMILEFQDNEYLRQTKEALPLPFKEINDKKLEIDLSVIPKRKLSRARIAVERGLNCVGCGACLALCSALKMGEDGKIKVIKEECTRCLKCTTTEFFHSGCIGRHYRKNIVRIVERESNAIQDISESVDRIGLIRRSKDIKTVTEKIESNLGLNILKVSENTFITKYDEEFLEISSKSPNFTNITLIVRNGSFNKKIDRIRRSLVENV